MMNCLQEMGYITGKIIIHGTLASEGAGFGPIKLTPKGYERIDVLQKMEDTEMMRLLQCSLEKRQLNCERQSDRGLWMLDMVLFL